MNDKPMKASVATNITAVTAYLTVSLSCIQIWRDEHTKYQSDPWVVMAMSAVPPLLVLPLMAIAWLPPAIAKVDAGR